MSIQTILLAEQDKQARLSLRTALEKEDFVVLEVCTKPRCLEILAQHPLCLMVLGTSIVRNDGEGFIKKVRALSDAPLIMISENRDEKDRIKGFEYGADDYVFKPFDAASMVARIHAHLRRSKLLAESNIIKRNELDSNLVRFSIWTLDRLKYQVCNDHGDVAALTRKEFELLDYLVSNTDRVLRRDELCEAIAEDSYIPTPRTIDVKITRIRKKIGDNAEAPNLIKTVRGVGYIFNEGCE